MKIDIEKIRDRVQRSTGERISIQIVSSVLSAAGFDEILDRISANYDRIAKNLDTDSLHEHEPVGWVMPSIIRDDGFTFTACEDRAKSWMVWSEEEVRPVYFNTQEEELSRARHSLMLVTQERDELRKETVSLGIRADELHQLVRQLEEQLDSERAANERLTHDCEIARQHLLKAISEKDNGHV